MSKQDSGAFPSFGSFNSQDIDVFEDSPDAGNNASLSFSDSDDGRRVIGSRRKQAEKKSSPNSLSKGDSPSSAMQGSSFKDNLYHQSFPIADEEKGEAVTNGVAKASSRDKKERSKKKPTAEEEISVQSEQRSTLTDGVSSARRSYQSGATPRRPTRQQRFALSTIPSTQEPAAVLENLFVSIEKDRQMHKLAGQNLRAVNNWILFLPSICLTLTAGVLALVSESGLDLSSDTRVYFAILVGVVALVAVFWQALTKQLDLGSRSALHEATAIALKRLAEDMLLTMSSTEDVPTEYITTISEKFGQAIDGCTSLIPLRIESAFATLQDRMDLILRPPIGQPRKQFYKKDFMRFHATAYDELTSEIIHHFFWPFHLPQPRVAADNAMRNFKEIVTEGREASRTDYRLFPCLGRKTTERSLFDVLPAASFVTNEEDFVRRSGTDV